MNVLAVFGEMILASGVTSFIFTSTATGCQSDLTSSLTIHPVPSIAVIGPNGICEGETTNLSPSTGGTWISTDPNIASINNSGLVTGLSSGEVSFVFLDNSTGCSSEESGTVIVYDTPVISLNGSDEIYVGETTSFLPSTGGTWQSENAIVASISNSGIVTGLDVGTANFIFTETSTGCISEQSDFVIVSLAPNEFVGIDADWFNPNSWTLGEVPAIPILNEITLSQNVNYFSIDGMSIGAGGSIIINNGVTFSVGDELNIDDAGMLFNNGVLTISGE